MPHFSCPIGSPDILWSEIPRGKAAVAMLFIPGSHSESDANSNSTPSQHAPARIVVTRRSLEVSMHKGQIAFAGGRVDAGEKTVRETVIREIEEEIGLKAERLKVHGTLQLVTGLTGDSIVPVVITASAIEEDFKLQESEIAELFLVPWTETAIEKNQPFDFNVFGNWRHSDFFDCSQAQIWGLTARVIACAGLISQVRID